MAFEHCQNFLNFALIFTLLSSRLDSRDELSLGKSAVTDSILRHLYWFLRAAVSAAADDSRRMAPALEVFLELVHGARCQAAAA